MSEKERLAADKVKLQREIEELKRRLEEAGEQIEALQRVVARQTAPFRRRAELKVPEGQNKRPGRKVGHLWVRRPRPPHVDHEKEVLLLACPQCGGPVQDRTPLTQYIEEIPPLEPVVTRLTTWKAVCPHCGEVHSSDPLQTSLAQGAAQVQLGPRAAALATLFNKYLGILLRKTCSLLKQGFGLSLTAGGLAQLLHRGAGKLKPQYEALQEQIRHSDVNYMDETSWYVGEPHWVLWVATSPHYTRTSA